MKYKAIIADIDGTLLNDERALTPENYQAIQTLEQNGDYFVLASGRPDAGMQEVMQACNLTNNKGFLIAFNGGKIMRTDTGEVLFSEGISLSALTFFADYAKANNLSICSYTEEKIIADVASEGVLTEAALTAMDYQVATDMTEYFTDRFIPKAIIFGTAEEVAASLAALTPYAESQAVEIAISNPTFLEITGKGINKGKALYKLADLLGISIQQMIAVGDGGNDLTMIQEAGLGVAVANAAPILKEHADEIMTISNNDHVIEALVQKYFF